MVWTKERVLAEFKRSVERNGGQPLGQDAFKKLLSEHVWKGKFWARYGDLVRAAGYEPKKPNQATNRSALLENFIPLIRKLSRFPTYWEQRLERTANPSFPSPTIMRSRFGSQAQIAETVRAHCSERADLADVEEICSARSTPGAQVQDSGSAVKGYIYLIKSGRHYKIGRANDAGRRGYEIGLQLPERHKVVHHFETDDPVGIEFYWHERFKAKRGNGEWFDLNAADVLAFKRRKKFM